ncbi:MAG: glutamine--tRNA ligase [Deltaproteobacteria bacterium]|nr:MAG: glutamine--tRNA ligase [Deltaproteobacteria bacterium]
MSATEGVNTNFIRHIINQDLASGKVNKRVMTRFPPEPNGYLHIGHAKSICLNFGIARDYNGICNLRFDDTNPEKESTEYIASIQEDVKWLGFDWEDRNYFASDYFQQLYDFAESLIENGHAFVCSLSAEATRAYRGTLTEPGKNSPYRNRTPEENLDLFRRMRAGEFADGAHVLRAKIDMGAPNMNMRDPVLYRIRKVHHHRTGTDWCIYPTYDYAHGLSDAIEGITHSLCTLEFIDHRPLYDWILDHLSVPCHPQQIEFARLNLNYTVVSKRKLLRLIAENHVSGWDDPRLPTLKGMRRRGFTPTAIRAFCDRIGVSKKESWIDLTLLEEAVRDDLNTHALRVMGVLDPVKVIIDNYPEDREEEMTLTNHPLNPEAGTRQVPFSKELYIEREDFMENPAKKFFRLAPGREVRLRSAYYITCTDVVKDPDTGEITEIHCTYDPESRGGSTPDGRKVKGTLHWVSARHALPAEIRLYDRLFSQPNPESDPNTDFTDCLNPDSLKVLTGSQVEPGLADALPESRFQFERKGYFCVDRFDSTPEKLVFNRTATLRDTWAKMKKQEPSRS